MLPQRVRMAERATGRAAATWHAAGGTHVLPRKQSAGRELAVDPRERIM